MPSQIQPTLGADKNLSRNIIIPVVYHTEAGLVPFQSIFYRQCGPYGLMWTIQYIYCPTPSALLRPGLAVLGWPFFSHQLWPNKMPRLCHKFSHVNFKFNDYTKFWNQYESLQILLVSISILQLSEEINPLLCNTVIMNEKCSDSQTVLMLANHTKYRSDFME